MAAAKTQAVTPAAGDAFVCGLWVGNVWLSGGSLRGETLGTCTGSLQGQYTGQQFQRDSWSGWRSYTTVTNGAFTADHSDDIYWSKGCNFGGDKNGLYNYRQNAIQWAMADDGTWHDGGAIHSGSNLRVRCGTGVS